MDQIVIKNLQVSYCVGVPDAERAVPQRLLLSLILDHDFSAASGHDDLIHTIDYFAVCKRLLVFGENKSWKLIESLASEIAQCVLAEFKPARVQVEVRKFIIKETDYVAVRIERSRLDFAR